MKKIRMILLAAVMLLGMVGCDSPDPAARQDNFIFTYNGTQIVLGADAAPAIDALGEPKSFTEEPSCAFDGLDKTYGYGSFYLSTYPLDGKDYVYSIWLVDDSVSTEAGIGIGDSQAEVEAAYGADCFNGINAYMLTEDDTKLTIILTDGLVSSVQYEIIVE